jgi:hypothetical protein
MDLVDQANYEQAKTAARGVFETLSDADKMALARELTIDRISAIIDKFPPPTQREILALLADKYLRQWA